MISNSFRATLKAVIIENQKMASTILMHYCERTGVEVIARFLKGAEALDFIKKERPDLVFVDNNLPDMSGFLLFENIPSTCGVIITSSDPIDAVAAHEYFIVDFLLKPFSYERFCKSIEKYFLKQYMVHREEENFTDFFLFKSNGLQVKLPIDHIVFMEAKGDYVKIQTEQRQYTILGTIKELRDKLDERGIVQVHRSYLVNLNKIQSFKNGSILLDNYKVPVSRTYKDFVKQQIQVQFE